MGKYSWLTRSFLGVREFYLYSPIYYDISQIFKINGPLAAISPVFLKMFETTMVETGEGILAVEDKSGESMEQLLKHIYTGSTDNFNDLKVDVVLELLNASVKVLWELENTSQESLLNSIVLYQLIFVTCYDLHSTNFPS
jgi:hypothetical protein